MLNKYIADRQFYRKLFLIVVPIILQYVIQNFINFLDNIMVGQLEEEAIAGVQVANQYYKVFYPAIVSICTGAAIYTAQYFGSNREKELQKVFAIKLIFPMFITFLVVIVGFIFNEFIITLFVKDELTIQYGIDYLKIAIWSFIPLTLSTAFTFTFRPLKMTHIPMIASSIGMVVNLLLNYLLIYGIGIFPELGVKGAAIATVIARVLELCVYLVILLKNDYPFKTNLKSYFLIDIKIVSNTFKKIIPLFINEVGLSLSLVVIFGVYSTIGKTSGIAAISIVEAAFQVVFMLASGLGTAAGILVGHKLGNNEIDEAEKNADYLLGYSVMVGIAIMFILIASAFVVPYFYNIDSSTKRIVTYAILIQAVVAPIMMFTRVPFFILRSGGRVKEIVFLDAAFMWVVKVPVAVLLGYVFNLSFIYIFLAVELTRVLNAVISMIFYKQKKWLTNLTP